MSFSILIYESKIFDSIFWQHHILHTSSKFHYCYKSKSSGAYRQCYSIGLLIFCRIMSLCSFLKYTRCSENFLLCLSKQFSECNIYPWKTWFSSHCCGFLVRYMIFSYVYYRYNPMQPVHEQALSNRACNICNFVVLGFL